MSEEQWKWLLKHRLPKLQSLSSLVLIYREHGPAIAYLDESIRTLDALIDSSVYSLYELTTDEAEAIDQYALHSEA